MGENGKYMEVPGSLVVPLVFKTNEGLKKSLVGSIPIHLRFFEEFNGRMR